MKVKPLSPNEVVFDIPDFVIETVNTMIQKKYRGSSFSFTCKELTSLGQTINPNNIENWYTKKWMDFESLYIKNGWLVEYHKPSLDESFDSYFKFIPNTNK